MDIIYKWLEKAEGDLKVAAYVLKDMHPKQIEISCYHAHTGCRKTLKGFLLYHEIEPPKTHNLVMLCQLCIEQAPEFEAVMSAYSRLTPYSVITRYPNDIEISDDDTEAALNMARKVYEVGTALIPEMSSPDHGPSLTQ